MTQAEVTRRRKIAGLARKIERQVREMRKESSENNSTESLERPVPNYDKFVTVVDFRIRPTMRVETYYKLVRLGIVQQFHAGVGFKASNFAYAAAELILIKEGEI